VNRREEKRKENEDHSLSSLMGNEAGNSWGSTDRMLTVRTAAVIATDRFSNLSI